jgi:membrane dipeptidase
MKKQILIWLSVLGILVVLAPRIPTFLQSFPELVHAQDSEEPFWVFDGHMHPVWSVYARGGTLSEANSDGRFTLPLAEQGALGAAFVNTAIDEFLEANHLAVKETLKQFDHFYRELARYPDRIAMATNAEEVRELRRQGKIAAILSIEGALALEGDLGVMRMRPPLGLREMNLVHLLGNSIGDVMHSSENGGMGYGLTEYGRELVAEMNRLGIVIDLSHTAEQTVMDVMNVSTQPVTTTHSAVRALVTSPNIPNWSDEMIRKIADMNGVICVPFLPMAVDQEYQDKFHRGRIRGSALVGLDPLVYQGEAGTIYDFIRERQSGGDAGRARMSIERRKSMPLVSVAIDHIDYIARLVGADHVAISTDFGGYPVNLRGIENAADYQNVAQALLGRGYSRQDVAKIMGENLLRVFDEVVSTAGLKGE